MYLIHNIRIVCSVYTHMNYTNQTDVYYIVLPFHIKNTL